jgi:hypothetical protein
MVENFVHDGGIGKERENNHRDCLRGGRALGTRESFYMQDPAEKLLPGEPSSSRAGRRFVRSG